jgi:hypothetical protein
MSNLPVMISTQFINYQFNGLFVFLVKPGWYDNILTSFMNDLFKRNKGSSINDVTNLEHF